MKVIKAMATVKNQSGTRIIASTYNMK